MSVPVWMEREVTKIGGNAGGKPRFRLVWGADRLILEGHVLVHPYEENRWHLEKWYEPTQQYEHAYKFGYCPHMKEGDKKWCRDCYLSGGHFMPLEGYFFIIERVIRMFLMSEQKQDAAKQKSALFEREKKAEEEQSKKVHDALMGNLTSIDRVPNSIRSKKSLPEPKLELTADKVLGTSKFRTFQRRARNGHRG